jgi:hypothetical protein
MRRGSIVALIVVVVAVVLVGVVSFRQRGGTNATADGAVEQTEDPGEAPPRAKSPRAKSPRARTPRARPQSMSARR